MNYSNVILILMLHLTASVFSFSNGRYKNAALNRNLIARNRHVRMNHELIKGEDCKYNICQQVVDYPEEEIENLIKNNVAFHSYFGGSVIAPDNFSLSSRQGDDELTSICRSRDVSVVPRLINDLNDDPRIIPNVKDYKQVLKFQLCDERDNACYPVAPLGNFKYECVQKFTVLKLLTVDVHTKKFDHKPFRIPSHCVCAYAKSDA